MWSWRLGVPYALRLLTYLGLGFKKFQLRQLPPSCASCAERVKRVLTEPSRGYNQSTIEKSWFKKILAHFQEVLRSATRLVPISFPSFPAWV